jgi:hypothetical protein
MIDWSVIALIAATISAAVIGAWAQHSFEGRARLLSYFSHVSSFTLRPPTGPQVTINTHSVVLRNNGRSPATNVRLHHALLPDYNVWPAIVHRVEELPDRTRDIVIPTLVPGEEVSISYLYPPPITFQQINAGVKCDQGIANQISVLLQRQYPAWLGRTLLMFAFFGVISILYFLYRIGALTLRAIAS